MDVGPLQPMDLVDEAGVSNIQASLDSSYQVRIDKIVHLPTVLSRMRLMCKMCNKQMCHLRLALLLSQMMSTVLQ